VNGIFSILSTNVWPSAVLILLDNISINDIRVRLVSDHSIIMVFSKSVIGGN